MNLNLELITIGDYTQKIICFRNHQEYVHYIIVYIKDNILMKYDLNNMIIECNLSHRKSYSLNELLKLNPTKFVIPAKYIKILEKLQFNIAFIIVKYNNNKFIFIRNLNISNPKFETSPEWDLNPRPTDLQSAVLPS